MLSYDVKVCVEIYELLNQIEPGRDLDEPAVKQEPQAKVQELHTMGPMKAPDEESSDMDLEADVLPTALGRR